MIESLGLFQTWK